MINNYLSLVPEEIENMIWKVYFQENVADAINQIIPAKKWEKPSKQLCSLCGDVGCIQQGDAIDTTMDVLFHEQGSSESSFCKSNNCKCTNCIYFGWPCLNHSVYDSKTIGISIMWCIGKNTKYDLPKDLHEDLKVDPDMTRILNLWY